MCTAVAARHFPLPTACCPPALCKQDYLDAQTAEELRKFSLPEIVAAVRRCGQYDPVVVLQCSTHVSPATLSSTCSCLRGYCLPVT